MAMATIDENWIVPFGKYKGRPLWEMLADRDYVEWCAQQPWFRDKFGNIYQFTVNRGVEPENTPEHNKMQAQFLDHAFCASVIRALKRWHEPITIQWVNFEREGWDVLLSFHAKLITKDHEHMTSDYLYVECKPTMGDDYPSVLRQIKRYSKPDDREPRLLLVGTYTGEAVPLASVRKIFASAGIKLILESECV